MTTPDPGLRDQGSWRSFLRIGGPVVLGIGLVLTAVALVDFFGAVGSFQGPGLFWMAFIGLPMIGVGWAMIQVGFLGPATRYVSGEVTPTIRDTLGALGMGAGLPQVCPACGARNALDARFCDDCGAPLRRACAACGAENAEDATFCKQCGAALPDAASATPER